jgi:hypothetical protein
MIHIFNTLHGLLKRIWIEYIAFNPFHEVNQVAGIPGETTEKLPGFIGFPARAQQSPHPLTPAGEFM